tara:strand:+ start:47 stop:304 length:258 start_codon:yes stop_codon:yes gene_type:complete
MGCGASKVYPIVFNKKSELDFNNKQCIICLESFSDNNEKIILLCGHSYHYNCILKWFDKELNCPTCKKKYVWVKDSKIITKKQQN